MLQQVIQVAREHNLVIFADEIYDRILYDDAKHTAIASLADDVVFCTLNGLSKAYRAAGFRSGWMVMSGAKHRAKNYDEGLNMLASMRLCANVPAQLAIQTALGGYQSIYDLTKEGGRLLAQRNLTYEMLSQIPGVSCVKPKGALYAFPRLDPKKFNIHDDEKFVLDLLRQEKILVVQGTAFNWVKPDHFRIVTLPRVDDLEEAIQRIDRFLSKYRQ